MKALTWIACALVALSVGVVAGHESAPPEPIAKESLAAIPVGVCPRGHVGMWIERGYMECLKEQP